MSLIIEHFRKWMRNTWEVLKCGAEEGWRKSVATNHAKNEKVLYRVKKEINILRSNWFVISCTETVF
jgi:predicted nucleic-acid-binding Zn-ribbon protein